MRGTSAPKVDKAMMPIMTTAGMAMATFMTMACRFISPFNPFHRRTNVVVSSMRYMPSKMANRAKGRSLAGTHPKSSFTISTVEVAATRETPSTASQYANRCFP